jgi:hypothetical protein
LEAIADALVLLESQRIGEPVQRAHELFVQRTLRARGRMT